jgi:hypothetical protein
MQRLAQRKALKAVAGARKDVDSSKSLAQKRPYFILA